MKKIIWFLFLSFTLYSCFKQPEVVSVNDIELIEVENDTLITRTNSTIYNPNSYNLKAERIFLKYIYKDNIIGKSYIDTLIVLNPKSNTDIIIDTKLNIDTLYKIIPDMIKQDSFPIDISIKAKVTSMKLPLSKKVTQYIKPQEIINDYLSKENSKKSFRIKQIQVVKQNLDSTVLKLNIEINNTLPVDYKIKSLVAKTYNNSNKNNLLGETKINQEILVLKKDKIEIPVIIAINNLKSIKGILSNILSKKNSVFIESLIIVEFNNKIYEIPIETTYNIPLPKFN